MCKSVPQIEAVRTRTNTSPGPIDGTGAFSKESPRAACILRKAFIVDGMETRLLVGQSMLAHANSRGAARLQQAGTAAPQLGKISTVSNARLLASQTDHFTRSMIPIFSKATKYSTTISSGTGPYSIETRSRICCASRELSTKFSVSYAYS